jgi:hypothetical protein
MLVLFAGSAGVLACTAIAGLKPVPPAEGDGGESGSANGSGAVTSGSRSSSASSSSASSSSAATVPHSGDPCTGANQCADGGDCCIEVKAGNEAPVRNLEGVVVGRCGAPGVHLCDTLDAGTGDYFARACDTQAFCAETDDDLFCCGYNGLGGPSDPTTPYVCQTAEECLGEQYCGTVFCKKPQACCPVAGTTTYDCVTALSGECPK